MTRISLIALFTLALLAGCNSDNSDRAGAEKPVEAKVLTMANANNDLGELEAFGAAVARESGGRLRIRWLNEYGRGRDGNSEVNLIRDVSSGKADLGWAGSRVFDELGEPAFNPLQAPLLIDSYELEERVLGDDEVVAPMLASLDELQLQGIGVLPGPLRHPLGRQPLRGPDDWAGTRILFSGGEQIEAALRALGAEPRYDNPTVQEATDDLDGIETHLAAVPGNHYHRDLPNLTGNLVLWPRPLVLFAGPDVSEDDLEVLRRAAREAIPDAVALSRSLEDDARTELCRAGMKTVSVSSADSGDLRDAFRPVYAELERDPAAQRTIEQIEELAQDAGGAADTVRCPERVEKASGATIPPGTYRTHITRADAKERGFTWAQVVESDPDPRALRSKTKEHRLEFTQDGTFTVYDVTLDGTANIGWEGSYSIYRDRITVNGNEGTKMTARVEIDGERLRFSDFQPFGPNTPEGLTWGSKPFVKID